MIVNVWGSWCGPCKEEIPIFRSFYEKAKTKVALVGIDVEEASIEDGRKFVASNGITWPNLYDPDGRSRAYFGLGVPVTWFIAADGSVAGKKIGVFKSEIELITLTSKYLNVKL
jgi:thiol-disulfide isomerase/thioredoxin